MDLIDRSLVLVVRRKSTDGIKACRVHDMLHDLCLKKAEEENFLQQICWYEEVSSSGFTADKQLFLPIAAKQRRLCVRSRIFGGISSEFSAQHIRSFLYFGSEKNPIPPKDMSFIEKGFNLLRVMDLLSISISHFPYSIAQLALLTYLAIKGKKFHLPDNISEFQYLETLIVSGELYYLPTSVWEMVKLRHLCIGGENVIPYSSRVYSLDGLQTISQVCASKGCQNVLTRTPNLRKLVLCGSFESKDHGLWFPDLEFLNHLKVLKLFNRFIPDDHTYNLQGVKFPPNLKELTLSKTHLAWEEMSIIGSLPNLESLKLEFHACVGPLWETSDGGFCRLKFLRFYYMNIEQWNASSNHFPVLEHLVLHRCRKLEKIPSDLGNIDTLQMIEVSCCSDSVIYSAKQIQEYQLDIANEILKIHIVSPPGWELTL
ncbi:putative late blight resistance protein homolog R1B-16 [Cornus florida]|uniref:putative late blight resistance protein homolog R1B-16 n=1 Tax=Cornus florida TaxID=4283 RepID=UPI00289A8809|nr:putative late blight resistance protein homolog R1B-16 [Cornus florida]